MAIYPWRPLVANQHGGPAPGADISSNIGLADIAGVGTRTIERAKALESKAAPEVKDAGSTNAHWAFASLRRQIDRAAIVVGASAEAE